MMSNPVLEQFKRSVAMWTEELAEYQGRFIKGSGDTGESYNGFGIWYDKKGYACIWIDGKSIKLHVFIWEQTNGRKPLGFEVHHKDLNKSNYSYDNLELLTHSDHQKLHAGWIKTHGTWSHKPCTKCKRILPLDSFYPRKGYTPSAMCKQCHCIVTSLRQKRSNKKAVAI